MGYINNHITGDFLGGYSCPTDCDGSRERVTKTLVFKRENLIESVRVLSGIVANGLTDAERTDEVKHHLDDIAEGGNMDRLNEVLNLGVLECVQILDKICAMDTVNDEEITDDYDLCDEWRVKLSLCPKTHEHTYVLVSKLIHELVTLMVLEDFLGLMGIENAALFEGRIENVLDKISKSVMGKKRTTRPMTVI